MMALAADDAAAKNSIMALVAKFGFDPIDA
jgi:predicted dinucleotide-binding enzyme